MSTVINTNLASLFAQNSLSNAQNNLATSVQRLSSGLRINSAKDDAAGLSIAQNMQGQINGTNQSIRNLSDATNLLQTADSSLSTVQDMILRMKQLSVQGYDGSLSISQKLNIVQELKDLNAEINATAQRTAFNGINLLTSGSSVDLVNSDLKTGVALANTAVAVTKSSQTINSVNELGYYANGGSAGTVGLNDAANTKVGGSGTVSTFDLVLDTAKSKYAPGTYTLINNGANLTLTGTYKGLTQSQTITLADITGNAIGGADKPVRTEANFSDFGISLNIDSTIGSGVTYTGSQLATNITARGTQITVAGKGAEISDVRLSGVAPGTYTMSYENLGTIGTLGTPASLTSKVTSAAAIGTLYSMTLVGGSGTTAGTADLTYDATGNITGIAVRDLGVGYKAGDVLSIAARAASTSSAGAAVTGTQGDGTHTEVSTVTFTAISAGDKVTVGGLSFQAKKDLTAIEVGSAFSNLSNGATTGGATSLGVYSGTLTGWSTAATSTAAAVFTSSSANTSVTDLTSTITNRLASLAMDGIAVKTLGTEATTTNLLKMTGTINGQTTTQSVQINAGTANTKQTLNFDSFGIQFDVNSYQAQSASDIGYALANINTGSNPSTYGTTGQLIPGQVVVARGNNSELKFQSGPTTDAFIQIDTLNIQTASTGAYAGTSSEMMNLGTRVTSSASGNLGALGANNTIDQWQTAFKNMADATDQALEYISTQRATYGSQMNRISFTSTNLTAQSTNLQNSRSAIIDTDFASETAKLTKGQIMQQAATAMLAQANQMPNVILSLLK